MAVTIYSYPPPGPSAYNTAQLTTEIIAAGLPTPAYVNGSGASGPGTNATSVQIAFDPDITPAQKTTLDNVVIAHVPLGPRKPRTVLAIYTDLLALTAQQKTNIGNDLFAGSPMKVLTDPGANAAAIFVLHWGAVNGGLGAAAIADAKIRAAAFWAQDNPAAFVHPVYDNTINVPGDQPA